MHKIIKFNLNVLTQFNRQTKIKIEEEARRSAKNVRLEKLVLWFQLTKNYHFWVSQVQYRAENNQINRQINHISSKKYKYKIST